MGSETKNPPETEALAGEVSEGSNANMHPERVARLGECKKRSRQMGRYLYRTSAGSHPAEVERLTNLSATVLSCASYLVFNNYYTVDQIRLAKITTCKKHLLCPVCARLRAAKQVGKYAERVQVLKDQNPKLQLALLTLTVKNGHDLEERFRHLTESWKKYQKKRRNWIKKGTGFNELCKIDGAVFSYEVTNKGNGWHPHLHAVVSLTDWIDQAQLSAEWEKITGDSKIVDVRRIKGDPVEGFLEVFKYALKFSELDLDLNFQAYETLRGKRLQGSFGNFRGVIVPENLTDELLDDLPFIEMFYKFMPAIGAYDLKETKHKSGFEGDEARRRSDDAASTKRNFKNQ